MLFIRSKSFCNSFLSYDRKFTDSFVLPKAFYTFLFENVFVSVSRTLVKLFSFRQHRQLVFFVCFTFQVWWKMCRQEENAFGERKVNVVITIIMISWERKPVGGLHTHFLSTDSRTTQMHLNEDLAKHTKPLSSCSIETGDSRSAFE